MQKDFSNISREELQKISQSDTAQQLQSLLNARHADTLETIRTAQDPQTMQQALSSLLEDPGTAQLLRQLQERLHG